MILIPAIDIKKGKCVRLTKGIEGTEKIYYDDPVIAAKMWKEKGAKRIHVVDLDGAFRGIPENLEAIEKICKLDLDVEVGGGIRDRETIERMFNVGVKWVIMGTIIVEDFEKFRELTIEFPGRIIAGIDVKGERVVKSGWVEESNLNLEEVFLKLNEVEIESVIVTDTERDGTLEGINRGLLLKILDISKHPIIVSGGVRDIEDILELKNLKRDNIKGVIIGKALYEKKLDLGEALKTVGGQKC
ncbi:MAG: 1-(5-phosphoribosyl)-5-[(5-phosphoribosylamino)methylideneamino]imidazole-4-carboxamide isomerase [Thermosulfidibacteraceae bacterium]|jgi:phosphoribosylformimino-5-aminoimidazole carboxamide ribotide isomerase